MTPDFDKAFKNFVRHKDLGKLRHDFDQALRPYPSLEMHETIPFRAKILEDVATFLINIDPNMPMYAKLSLPFEKSAGIYFDALELHPELMAEANNALACIVQQIRDEPTILDRVEDIDAEIPMFNILKDYAAVKHNLQNYVSACLDYSVSQSTNLVFPPYCYQIKDTDFVRAITHAHVEANLKDTLKTFANQDAENLAMLKLTPRAWTMIEAMAPALFCAYTPDIDEGELPRRRDIGYEYNVAYCEEKKFMAIEFQDIVKYPSVPVNSSWTKNLHRSELLPTYLLLGNALGILQGQFSGETTNDYKWTTYQRTMLLKHLTSDVQQLEKDMLKNSIAIPKKIPAAIIPQATSSPSSGGFNWAAHRAMRP